MYSELKSAHASAMGGTYHNFSPQLSREVLRTFAPREREREGASQRLQYADAIKTKRATKCLDRVSQRGGFDKESLCGVLLEGCQWKMMSCTIPLSLDRN